YLDKLLSKRMDKGTTTLHWDGQPSEQKPEERRRRQGELDKNLTKLQKDVARAVEKKKAVPARLYQSLNWKVCTCEFQADSHIGQICQAQMEDDEVLVVSGDSNLLVYEGINRITMSVGRRHELTTFQKSDVLSLLDLPSNRHLLLACLLTRNDYNEGIRGLELKRNAAIVRKFDLDLDVQLDQVIAQATEKYLDVIGVRTDKTIKNFKNALTALASLKFKSCNADKNAWYTLRVVQDTSKVPKLQEEVLKYISVEEPRAAKAKAADGKANVITSQSKPSNKPIQLG
ncbi:hypothetical protein BGZ65_004850, partial [Modicella reniformis]